MDSRTTEAYRRLERMEGPEYPLCRGEKGQAMVVLALFLPVFVLLLGLVFDVGYAYVFQRQLQTAADAASLGGAHEMARGTAVDVAAGVADRLLQDNGADVVSSTVTIGSGRVAVRAAGVADLFFLPIIGIHQIAVAAESEAAYGALGGADDVLPFAVAEDLWEPGQSVVLTPPTNQTVGPGNFTWVAWADQSPDVATLVSNIVDPSASGTVAIGDTVGGAPGNMFNPPVAGALQGWLDREVTIFLYAPDAVSEQGNRFLYVVQGFARFRITHVDNALNEIRGTFVEYVRFGGPVAEGGTTGVGTVTLVR